MSEYTPTTERERLATFLHGEWCNSTHHRTDRCRRDIETGLDAGKADRLRASDWLAAHDAEVRRAVGEEIAQAIEALPGPDSAGIRDWEPAHQDAYLLAIEEASEVARNVTNAPREPATPPLAASQGASEHRDGSDAERPADRRTETRTATNTSRED